MDLDIWQDLGHQGGGRSPEEVHVWIWATSMLATQKSSRMAERHSSPTIHFPSILTHLVAGDIELLERCCALQLLQRGKGADLLQKQKCVR